MSHDLERPDAQVRREILETDIERLRREAYAYEVDLELTRAQSAERIFVQGPQGARPVARAERIRALETQREQRLERLRRALELLAELPDDAPPPSRR